MAQEDPIRFPTGETKLIPMFTSDTVLIMKEEEAFPLVSLLADIGGVLGLFIGFNFLMVYEWMVLGFEMLSPKLNNTKIRK